MRQKKAAPDSESERGSDVTRILPRLRAGRGIAGMFHMMPRTWQRERIAELLASGLPVDLVRSLTGARLRDDCSPPEWSLP